MAISRMQQPRQMYGLGSFVKKLTRKVTRPITKVASKIVPKEIAGIMRLAAPFLGPVAGPAAYLLGTAKQTGRISPIDLALTLAPTVGKMTLPGEGKFAKLIPDNLEDLTVSQAIGNIPLPFTKKDLGDVLVGNKRYGTFEGPRTEFDTIDFGQSPGYVQKVSETSGIFGKGGEMFKLGKDKVGLLDTKVGQTLFGKPEMKDGDPTGSFVPSYLKIGSTGVSLASLIKDAKTPEEAGNALVEATGNSDDYEAGVQMFSALPQGIFDIPQQFRLNSANGGLMRTNYARGAGDKGVVNPFLPKPQGPVLPDEDKPFTPKPLKPIKMAEFDLLEYQEEFERVFPDMKGLRGTDEYNEMLEDYFRGLASKDREGIMMAGSLGDEKDDISKEIFGKPVKDLNPDQLQELMEELERLREKFRAAKGGRANLALGTKPTTEESGLGGLPIEADMRYTGGFMPYGEVEKADDVPARLSKNEFVFTADAVRAAGGGSVNEGAKKMYTAMKQLEKKPEAKGMMA